MYVIPNVLTTAELSDVNASIDTLSFVDGKATATGRARDVKDNEQASTSPELTQVQQRLSKIVLKNSRFQAIVQPRALTDFIISRYGEGKQYGFHVDNAVMNKIRADVSYTLFLRDPTSYEGGELIVRLGSIDKHIKLPAGHMICYPSNTLHRVAPVLRNERLAAVGWAQSYVRDAEKREILRDLNRIGSILKDKGCDDAEMDLLGKTYSNLQRQWFEG